MLLHRKPGSACTICHTPSQGGGRETTAFPPVPSGRSLSASRFAPIALLQKKIPGSYTPLYTNKTTLPVKVQYLESLQTIISCTTILTADTAFKDTFLIETLKGCPHGCRFCSAGFIYRPPRIYPKQNIFAAIDQAMERTDKVGFVSSAIADHPDMIDICEYGLTHKLKLSFSSLRADKLDNKFILALSNSKIKTATLAPEAG